MRALENEPARAPLRLPARARMGWKGEEQSLVIAVAPRGSAARMPAPASLARRCPAAPYARGKDRCAPSPSLRRARSPPTRFRPPPSFPDHPRLAAHCAPAPFPPDSPSPQACSLPEPRAWTARTAPSAPRRRAPGRARPARCVAPARRDERALPRSLARSPAVTRRGYEPATLRAPRGNATTDIKKI